MDMVLFLPDVGRSFVDLQIPLRFGGTSTATFAAAKGM